MSSEVHHVILIQTYSKSYLDYLTVCDCIPELAVLLSIDLMDKNHGQHIFLNLRDFNLRKHRLLHAHEATYLTCHHSVCRKDELSLFRNKPYYPARCS